MNEERMSRELEALLATIKAIERCDDMGDFLDLLSEMYSENGEDENA